MPHQTDIKWLKQNWTPAERQEFYTTTQGSHIMPYKWFLALERADSETPFNADGLSRFGYIPNSNTNDNPDSLPVGFAKDTYRGENYVGMTCAACHTNQIEYKDTVWQIDGAPALADMHAFIVAIKESLKATLTDQVKFERFAQSVGGNKTTLRTQLTDFADGWNVFVTQSTPPVPWGHARLDAFGMIFNRVSSIDLHYSPNNRPPDAPVSYPFLWGTHTEDKVQWNGIAPNTNAIARLGRNVGEVLGVFADADLRDLERFPWRHFETSAKRIDQYRLEEELLSTLWSPQWPNELGPVDKESNKYKDGKALFTKHCVACHEVVPHGDQKRPVTVIMTWIDEMKTDPHITFPPDSGILNTDPKMALNAATRTSETRELEGEREFFSLTKTLPAVVPSAKLLTFAVAGAILDPSLPRVFDAARDAQTEGEFSIEALLTSPAETYKELKFLREIADTEIEKIAEPQLRELSVAGSSNLERLIKDYEDKMLEQLLAKTGEEEDAKPILMYKARPLDGIWATAPYLHNGSVPNLYELLKRPENRVKTFHVGTRKFDPVKVGFETGEGPGTTPFDTNQEGNSNSGHDYGTSVFSEDDREALVEYMKTL